MCTTAPDHEDHLYEECLPAVSEEQRDSLLLNLMLCEDQAFPWSREELARVIGNQIGAFDAVARLEEDGLVHRVGEFVSPRARAAVPANWTSGDSPDAASEPESSQGD